MIRLGQHFLTDKNALKKIVALLDLKESDTVIEIGPGHGELTEELRFKNKDLRIIAIEKDELLANDLRSKIYDLGIKNVDIITGDALKILKSLIINLKSYKIVGNIPYYITGKLLRTIGELEKKPEVSVLTIQKEVAERLTANPPKMNRLAASVQFWAKPEIAFIISRNDFNPAPEIDSATIVLKKAAPRKIEAGTYYEAVRAVFAQPRKTILNNLFASLKISKNEIEVGLRKADIGPASRPQNLSVENIIELASLYF